MRRRISRLRGVKFDGILSALNFRAVQNHYDAANWIKNSASHHDDHHVRSVPCWTTRKIYDAGIRILFTKTHYDIGMNSLTTKNFKSNAPLPSVLSCAKQDSIFQSRIRLTLRKPDPYIRSHWERRRLVGSDSKLT